jgi:hypothetical protein
MLTGVKDGRTLSLAWPRALPVPTLEANVATYAEVLPGVDLQLKAEVEGFSQLLVVKTAEAADNPELAELQFTMDTVGLEVAEDADTGMLAATDPAGQTVFTSPAPSMWDSSAPAAPALRTMLAAAEEETAAPGDAFEPGAGSQEAQMATEVSGDTLTITPDQELLYRSGDDLAGVHRPQLGVGRVAALDPCLPGLSRQLLLGCEGRRARRLRGRDRG